MVIAADDVGRLIRQEMEDREAARRGLVPFVSRFWKGYTPGWVHHDIGMRLKKFRKAVQSGKSPRLIITMPPQHGKSTLSTIGFPAWVWSTDPTANIILGCYSQELASDFGESIARLIESRDYRTIAPHTAIGMRGIEKRGVAAKNKFNLTAGAMFRAVGVGGSATGRNARYFIIDDPFKGPAEADSDAYTKKVMRWYYAVAMTRLAPGGGILIVMCMTGDTDVRLADGSSRKLRDVRPGDNVATYDAGKLTTARVLNWKNQGVDDIFEVRLKSEKTARANARHPFLVDRNGVRTWLRLSELTEGDQLVVLATLPLDTESDLRCSNQQPPTSDFTLDEIVSILPSGREEVFDIQIEGTENFIANGLVSHNTRWGEKDLVGQLLDAAKLDPAADQWEVVEYPALAKHDEKYRNQGDALHPERYSRPYLEGRRASFIAGGQVRQWNALYQCNPTPDQGVFFKKEWIRQYDSIPNNLTYYAGTDWAIGGKALNDYTVIAPFGVAPNGDLYFTPDIYRRQGSTGPESVRKLKELMCAHSAMMVAYDHTVIGKALEGFIRESMGYSRWKQPDGSEVEDPPYSFSLWTFSPSHDKATHASALRVMMENGHVWFPRCAAFDEVVIPEMMGFLGGAKNDDCFPADTPVLTERGWVPIASVTTTDRVWTRGGWRMVLKSWAKGIRPVITRFGITATPEHPLYTVNRGWVALDAITRDDTLLLWNEKPSSSMGDATTDTLDRSALTFGATSGATTPIKDARALSTETPGSAVTDPFPSVITSTTKTGIRSTIDRETSNASPQTSIAGGTWQKLRLADVSQPKSSSSSESERVPPPGTPPGMGDHGIEPMPSVVDSGYLITASGSVLNAEGDSPPKAHAPHCVGSSVEADGENPAESLVYDLMVEHDHEFVIGGGYLVHNCVDAMAWSAIMIAELSRQSSRSPTTVALSDPQRKLREIQERERDARLAELDTYRPLFLKG